MNGKPDRIGTIVGYSSTYTAEGDGKPRLAVAVRLAPEPQPPTPPTEDVYYVDLFRPRFEQLAQKVMQFWISKEKVAIWFGPPEWGKSRIERIESLPSK